MGMSPEEYRRLQEIQRQAKGLPPLKPEKKKRKGTSWIPRSKPEQRTALDGTVFGSKSEVKWYEDTVYPEKMAGRIRWWAQYPIFWLGGVKYTPEAIVCWEDGVTTIHEVKGKGAPEEVKRRYKRNAVQMKCIYGIDVILEQR